jgi:alpha-tubulin suppressor-like RCC1 family protein
VRISTPAGVRDVVRSSGGGAVYVLLDDGNVWLDYAVENPVGQPFSTGHFVDGLSNVTALAGGWVNNYALKSDGTVWGLGFDNDGNLGDGPCPSSFCEATRPVQVRGLTGVVSIAGGDGQGYAVKADGTVWAWGKNAKGLSTGSADGDATTPIQVAGLTGVVSVAAHENYGLALKSDGTVWAWGNNQFGTLDNGQYTDAWQYTVTQAQDLAGVTAITAGAYAGYAVKSDGTVWTWGQTACCGRPSQVPGLIGASKVAADRRAHAYALVPHQG